MTLVDRLRRRLRHWQHRRPAAERDRLRMIVGDSDGLMSSMCRHGHHGGPCSGCRCYCHPANQIGWPT